VDQAMEGEKLQEVVAHSCGARISTQAIGSGKKTEDIIGNGFDRRTRLGRRTLSLNNRRVAKSSSPSLSQRERLRSDNRAQRWHLKQQWGGGLRLD
jgi:hypothetical protein